MLTLNNGSQNDQKQDQTVKARKPMLEKKYKKRRKMGTRRFIISN